MGPKNAMIHIYLLRQQMPQSSTELIAGLLTIRAIYKTMPTMVRCGNLNWIQLDTTGHNWIYGKEKTKYVLSKFRMALRLQLDYRLLTK